MDVKSVCLFVVVVAVAIVVTEAVVPINTETIPDPTTSDLTSTSYLRSKRQLYGSPYGGGFSGSGASAQSFSSGGGFGGYPFGGGSSFSGASAQSTSFGKRK